ncbi:YwiC-like family protein [Neobacillus sp. MM2021_6]|uniref:YwiC-like family protein n=1 Tax=Bacillaceae TaxID=186817 RepID=UPI001407A296|nr:MULTISPECIES: YwiC-like family protein [Bacillaceae]MBO0961221.1 YwiC-like family protein [Neobacillus sp. MM2021_6]NHC20915.1 YwiC-like family protein [Bacillus sp. MM2020_4]
MKLFLPKQHGAWAMLIIPFWLGVMDGGFLWQHIPFFLGWLLLYLATYPMLLLFKKKKLSFYTKWTLIYMIPALLLLLIPLIERPSIVFFGLLMIPFFTINAYYTSRNQDRAFMNDISAILVFSIAGLASSFLGQGVIGFETIISPFLTSVLFFIGCTFYVKSMIREKKNTTFKWISWIYHLLLVIAWIASGFWIAAIAYIPSLFRAIIFYGKKLSPKQIGIYEIINSAIFFILITIQHIL